MNSLMASGAPPNAVSTRPPATMRLADRRIRATSRSPGCRRPRGTAGVRQVSTNGAQTGRSDSPWPHFADR